MCVYEIKINLQAKQNSFPVTHIEGFRGALNEEEKLPNLDFSNAL